MKDAGIVYVVIGESYEQLAVQTVALSRENTGLPIHVFTDIPRRKRSSGWKNISDVSVETIKIDRIDNRKVKTLLYQYTPFEDTLFLDCDSVIQRPGVESLFDLLNKADFVVAPRSSWGRDELIPEPYVKAFRILGIKLPVEICYGALFAFNQGNERAQVLMDRWHLNWEATGKYRDLPALVAALKTESQGEFKYVNTPEGTFSLKGEEDPIVWHPQPGNPEPFLDKFKLPRWVPWSPQDLRYEKWNWVPENVEMTKERELEVKECPTEAEVCLSVYTFGEYAEYLPFLIFSTLWSYPDFVVKAFLDKEPSRKLQESFDYIRRQLSSRFEIIPNYKSAAKMEAFGTNKSESQLKKMERWLIPGSEFAGYKYVYHADVDFITVPESPTLLEFHQNSCREFDLPYSNPVRWGYNQRVSGLQFVETKPFFEKVDPIAEAYRIGEKIIPDMNNEAFLCKLMVEAGLGLVQTGEREKFERLRPHHGLHVGLVRDHVTPPYYQERWNELAPEAYPILSSQIFEALLEKVDSLLVRRSLERTICFINESLGPKLRENLRGSKRSKSEKDTDPLGIRPNRRPATKVTEAILSPDPIISTPSKPFRPSRPFG